MKIPALIRKGGCRVSQKPRVSSLFFGAFVFLSLAFFPNIASAGFWGDLLAKITAAAEVLNILKLIAETFASLPQFLVFSAMAALIAGFFNVVIGILAGMAFSATRLLEWLITATLSIPVIPGRGVAVVDAGWAFSRDLVNMLFILILAVIGIATILRIQSYQLQRLIPAFIIIALLVNFSGVLVGLVVDIANILTVAFLDRLSGTLGELAFAQFKDAGTNIWETLECAVTGQIGGSAAACTDGRADPVEFLGRLLTDIVNVIVILIFYSMLVLLLLAMLLVFMVRIGILWALSIVAPFAFAAYILPATRGLWRRWLQTLIQWAFVGVPLTFFLWLAAVIASAAAQADVETLFNITGAPGILGGVEKAFRDVFILVIAPFMSILFLFIGLMLSFGLTSKMGSAVLKWAGRATSVTAGVLARDAVQSGLAKSAKVQKLAQRMEGYSSEGRSGIFHNVVGRMAAPWTRMGGRLLSSKTTGAIGSKIDKFETAVKDMGIREMGSRFKGGSMNEKAGIVNAAIKIKKIDDLLDKDIGGVTEKGIREVYKHAKIADRHKDIDAALPFLREDEMKLRAADRNPGFASLAPARQRELMAEQYNEQIFKKMEGDRTERISEKVFEQDLSAPMHASGTPQFKNAAVMEAIVRNFGPRRFSNLVGAHENIAPPAIGDILKQVSHDRTLTAQDEKERDFQKNRGINSADAERNAKAKAWLQENNPALLKSLRSDTGQV
ncbi:hypothetical protein IID24_04095, partial [Patescibacteria group bacterium]|nr:hypothetical protein [Patescibacteria group bacterium]